MNEQQLAAIAQINQILKDNGLNISSTTIYTFTQAPVINEQPIVQQISDKVFNIEEAPTNIKSTPPIEAISSDNLIN